MKNLFLSFFILVSFYSYTQESYILTDSDLKYVDSLKKNGVNWDVVYSEFITLLNVYRKEHNLDTLVFSESAFNAAKFQNDYCQSISSVTHENMTEGYKTFSDRVNKFNLKNNMNDIGECAQALTIYSIFVKQQTIAECLLDRWISSPKHNAVLLQKNSKYFGICAKRRDNNTGAIYSVLVIH
jgi:uncharacterized protein YkwD